MKNLNIAIVGLGGIGSIVADNLYPLIRSSMCDYTLRNMLFVDHDEYSVSNIPRQKAAAKFLGLNKAVAWESIYSRSTTNAVRANFHSSQEWITTDTINSIFGPYVDSGEPFIIMSCVDNHAARLIMSKYVQERCKDKHDFVLIQAGCDRDKATADLYGVWNGETVGTPIEQNHPEITEDDAGDRGRMSCEELANLPSGDQTFVDNFMAGTMEINLLFTLMAPNGEKCLKRFIGETMICSAHYYQIDKREMPRPVVSNNPEEATEEKKDDEDKPDPLQIVKSYGLANADKLTRVCASNTELFAKVWDAFVNTPATPDEIVLNEPSKRDILADFIREFGDHRNESDDKLSDDDVFILVTANKRLTPAARTALIRFLQAVNR